MSLSIEEQTLVETAEWALDMMEMYEKRLIEFGDPPHLVNSEIHNQGKAKAQWCLNFWRLKQIVMLGSDPLPQFNPDGWKKGTK